MKLTASRNNAYTLVEVLIAAVLLVMAIGAAAALALSMVSQEESNVRVARALNLHEQAAHLYQLGLAPDTVSALLPQETNVTSISFITTTSTIAGVGDVEQATCTMIYHAGLPLTSDELVPTPRTNGITVIRPTLR